MACAASTEPTTALDPPPALPDSEVVERCDAGDEAFVRRLIPALWGRRPASSDEVDLLAQLAASIGREGLVERMARSSEYVERWRLFVLDAMTVSRIHERSNPWCYGTPLLWPPDAELAAHVRDHTPQESARHSSAWTMYDLTASALVLDDLSPVYLANLFVHLSVDFRTPNPETARGFRGTRVLDFTHAYLGRRLECLTCHTSRASTTDHPDPALDRTWQVPGWFEEAVFGDGAGRPIADMRPFFRRRGVVAGAYYDNDPVPREERPAELLEAHAPWGIDISCGRYWLPEEVAPDDLQDDAAFFIRSFGADASVWDLVDLLRTGFDTLRAPGSALPAEGAADQHLGGEEAFVWMLAMTLADQVWSEVHGFPLTVSHGFARVEGQRDILRALAERFVQNGYSLRSLVAAAVLHPYFNQRSPATCLQGAADAYLLPVFDPWGEEDGVVGDLRNTVGQTVQRLPARTLVRSATWAMGWAPPQEFFLTVHPDPLYEQLGVFMKPPAPGFRGTSFQMTLAWEHRFAACRDPQPDECAYFPILEEDLYGPNSREECPLCGQAAAEICAWDERCCDVDWAAICDPIPCTEKSEQPEDVFMMSAFPPPPRAPDDLDFVSKLLQAAPDSATFRDAVAALKDRLLTDPRLADSEAPVLEALLGRSLGELLSTDPDADARLRRVCGALLATPQFLLYGLEGAIAPPESRPGLAVGGSDFESLCQHARATLFDPGELTCEPGTATVSGALATGPPRSPPARP